MAYKNSFWFLYSANISGSRLNPWQHNKELQISYGSVCLACACGQSPRELTECPEGDEILTQTITPSGRYGIQSYNFSPEARRGKKRRKEVPWVKDVFNFREMWFSPSAWSFQSKWQDSVRVCNMHQHAHVQRERQRQRAGERGRHLINVSGQTNLRPYTSGVVCVLHNTHPDRFIIDGEPMLHIRPLPSIGRAPVALNFHWEPLHLKMEVRSLSPWHTGSEKDQQALLKSFSSAAFEHPSLTGCIGWIWLFLTFAGFSSRFVVLIPKLQKFNLIKSVCYSYLRETPLSEGKINH